MDRAIDLRYPSIEKQLQDLAQTGALPSRTSISGMYEDRLLAQLRRTLPMNTFGAELPDYGSATITLKLYEISKFTEERTWFKWRGPKVVKKLNQLAEFEFDGGGTWKHKLEVHVYDPLFLHVCKEEFLQLNKYFEPCRREYNLIYNYVVK